MRTWGKLAIAGLTIFATLQLVRPDIPSRPSAAEVQAPPAIQHILDKSCYSCHSDQRRLSWFDEIVPAYWLVRFDVLKAREHLNFSTLGSKPAVAQRAALFEAVNMIQLGAMPLPRFVQLHPESKVTAEDMATLKAYLAPWATAPASASSDTPSVISTRGSAPLASVSPEFNGFAFDPNFESWKLLSATDRGDNHTFRFVLGNEVAVRAIQAANLSPWPDGTRFAKIAWQQETGPDGLIHPGKFVQVELMLKGNQRYSDTQGWGWGRWRGMDLKPYGTSAAFVNECTGCHQPLRGNDYVYTLPITPVQVAGKELVNNTAAALPAKLPYQPLGWGAITMYVDPAAHTMSILFGNDAAIRRARSMSGAPGETANFSGNSSGAILALVTWGQREDPHWFGARIPYAPKSVEFVEVKAHGEASDYRLFAGQDLTEEHPEPATVAKRISFLIGLTPASLP